MSASSASGALRAHLIRIDARITDGTLIPVHLSSVNDSRVCHLEGVQWDPALVRVPVLRYDFFGGAFQNAIALPQAQFSVITSSMASVPPGLLGQLRFAGARVQVWTGPVGAGWSSFTLRYDGRITAEPALSDFLADFSAQPDDAWLDVPLLATYAGTGGLEGPEDLTGAIKPLVLGNARFVPGVLIDPVDNVYQVSAYGPVSGISAAFDRLASLGPSSGDHADLAALLAATISSGSWATCLALGLVRLGDAADGLPSFHVAGDAAGAGGYVRRAGAMIARLAELAGGHTDSANVAALDAARPWNLERLFSSQITARQAVQELADSVAAVAGISWTGQFWVQPYGFGAAEILLDAGGTSDPLVSQVSQQPVDPPFWRLATFAAPTWQVHSLGDIASAFTPRGIYSAARTYRLDDLVSAADGRSFVYINATPGAGNAPPVAPATSNAHWLLFGAADVTASSQVSIDPVAAIAVTADSEGVTTSDLALMSRRVVLRQGSVDVSASAVYAIGALPGGIVGAFGAGADANLFTLSQADLAGSVPVAATLGGVEYATLIVISRTLAAAPELGGAGNTDPVTDEDWPSFNSASFTTLTDANMIIASSGAGELRFSAGGAVDGVLDLQCEFKYQTSPDGTTWTDRGSTFLSTAVQGWRTTTIPGSVSNFQVITGLGAATDLHVRLQARRVDGFGGATFMGENFTVRHP